MAAQPTRPRARATSAQAAADISARAAPLQAGAGAVRIETEQALAASCLALMDQPSRLSSGEAALAAQASWGLLPPDLHTLRAAILQGEDPLGDAFSALRSATHRRAAGAVYTPQQIVQSMVAWLAAQGAPARIVDPGAGSGRFILAAGAAFADAALVAVENDPLAALMLRANLGVRGWTDRASIVVGDFRELALPPISGQTAFIGNPPYVRHHEINDHWKAWYAQRFAAYGIRASALAGLHLHFFLQTRLLAQPADVGVFVTSAEWLDVNYGSALRRLLLDELGGTALHVLAPTVAAFPGTATTAAITCFRVGQTQGPVRVRAVDGLEHLNALTAGTDIPRAQLQAAARWSIIVRPTAQATDGDIELGELFRVHRGQVTGANGIWIAGAQAHSLPDRIMMPAVTKARDLILAGAELHSPDLLRRVIDLPAELDELSADERRAVNRFLAWAKLQGADQGYIARHRRAWWSVGLKAPAPILCTYMARRPPQFTRNTCNARHINVAHGLYPREPLAPGSLGRLVKWLNANITTGSGRTYAGGLTKFEPKEIERLRIPRPDNLHP